MNNIDSIIIHCSATKAGQDFKIVCIVHVDSAKSDIILW